MKPTLLQAALGFTSLTPQTRVIIEAVLAALTAAGAWMARGNRRSLRASTLMMISIGFVLDLATVAGAHERMGWAALTAAVSLVLVGWGLIKLLLDAADGAAHRSRAHFSTIFKDILMTLLFAVVVMAVLAEDFHVDPTPLLASSAVVAVVLGLALQESLGNVFSGVTLQLGKPFSPGDWVRSGASIGRVQGISWRSTTVITRANEKLEIPNAMLAKDIVINYSNGIVADEIVIGLSYEAPPNYVREVVLEALLGVSGVLQEPKPDVFTWEYGDFAVRYHIRYWLSDYADIEHVRDSVTTSLWYVLRRKSIEVAFPVRVLRTQPEVASDGTAVEFQNEMMDQLRQVDFLRELPDEELRLLLPGVTVLKFGAGEIIVREGDHGDSLYIIRSGVVEVIAGAGDGRQVHIRDLQHPAFFGEMALMTGEPRTATIRARTDAELLELNREGFTELFKLHPETAAKIGEVIALRMTERREAIDAKAHEDAGRTSANWLLAKMRAVFNLAVVH